MKQIKINQDSQITQVILRKKNNNSEFVTAVINKDTLLTEERLEKAFKLFDQDSSGKISINELKEIFGKGKLTDQDWKTLIKDADENGDGEVKR